MDEERIKTTENFTKLLPFSGGAVAVEMFRDVGLFYHLNVKLPDGGYVILSVSDRVAEKYPEYFKIEK